MAIAASFHFEIKVWKFSFLFDLLLVSESISCSWHILANRFKNAFVEVGVRIVEIQTRGSLEIFFDERVLTFSQTKSPFKELTKVQWGSIKYPCTVSIPFSTVNIPFLDPHQLIRRVTFLAYVLNTLRVVDIRLTRKASLKLRSRSNPFD